MTKKKWSLRKKRRSHVKGTVLMVAAAVVLLTYPVGVVLKFLASDAPDVSAGKRLWRALGWPLVTFTSLMDKASAHLPSLTSREDNTD